MGFPHSLNFGADNIEGEAESTRLCGSERLASELKKFLGVVFFDGGASWDKSVGACYWCP